MPSALDVIRTLLSPIPPERWIVSVNSKRKGPVKEFMSALNGDTILVRFVYTADGKDVKIEGTMPLKDAGKPGGNDTIKVDGKDVELDDIVLSNRLVFPSGVILICEFKYLDGDENMRVRFDGRALKLGPF